MKTCELAKIIDLIAHPLRVKILKSLNRSSLSYSQLLKALSLNSTSKLSFHLDKLLPLIEKDNSGLYSLSDAGLNLIDLIDSYEKQTLFDDSPVPTDLDDHYAKVDSQGLLSSFINNPKFFALYYSLNAFLFSFVIIHIIIEGYYFVSDEWKPIFDTIFVFLVIIMLFVPIGFFILYFIHLKEKAFSTFLIGETSYIILIHNLYHFLYICVELFFYIIQHWRNNSNSLIDALIIFIDSMLINRFVDSYFPVYYFSFVSFLIICLIPLGLCLFLISLKFSSKKWKRFHPLKSNIFSTKFKLVENPLFWIAIIFSGIFIVPAIVPIFTEEFIFDIVFFSQILPIGPTLLLSLIILSSYKLPFPKYILIIGIIFIGPLFLAIELFIDPTFQLRSIFLIVYQIFGQIFIVIMLLKIVKYRELKTI